MSGVIAFGLSFAPRLAPRPSAIRALGRVQWQPLRAPLVLRAAPPARRHPAMSTATGKKHLAAMDDVRNGEFKRKESVFRGSLSADGSTPFAAEPRRYRLYISLACPWASRCFMVLSMQGLLDSVPITVVHHYMSKETGWAFVTADDPNPPPMCEPEPLYGLKSIRELYFKADPKYAARFTVPVLWDTKTETIVNNESSELIVMINQFAKELGAAPDSIVDLYPEDRQFEIDKVAQSFYNGFNNGVYRCGFATTQEAYDVAFEELFSTMDALEEQLASSRYLCGDKLTLADVRLFPTLIRFDPVYVQHFKTNKKRVFDYPNLLGYTRELYQMEAIKRTVSLEHIKKHYHRSHPTINPHGIVPGGPDMSYLDEPHGRG
jgi:glutathionyl-hydroquinone reductase